MKYVIVFLFYMVWIILPLQAGVFKITDFPRYEFYKYNFSYQGGQSLNSWAEPSRPPIFSLSFLDQEIAGTGKSVPVQWDDGVSGKAVRFYGKGSAYPLGWEDLFSRDRLSSFTLSFYFRPLSVMREETLLWGEQENTLEQTLFKSYFKVQLKNGYVHWDLEDFFSRGRGKISRSLKSHLPFHPGEWNHLVLGYDAKNARLIMRMNGEMVDFAYATSDGKRSGSQYAVGFPEREDSPGLWVTEPGRSEVNAAQGYWVLGKGFTGLIDEIELFDNYISVPSRLNHQDHKGAASYYSTYASRVFRLPKNSRIHSAELLGKNISSPYIHLYLCQSKDYFPEHVNFTDCNRILWQKSIVGYPAAEFYQFFLVYDNREYSLKSLEALLLSYREDTPPLPPQWVTLEQNRDGMLMEWKHTLEEVAGYRIYYRPGDFQGEKSMLQLNSEKLSSYKTRQDVWSYVLEGLEKDTLYYFGITSYDLSNGQLQESDLSTIKSFYYSSDFFN